MNGLSGLEIRVGEGRSKEPVRHLAAEDLLSFRAKTNTVSNLPIAELSIQGLLSFGEETFFEFGRLNILVGPNGSGKSNLIDCIRILRNSPFDIQETFVRSGFQEWLYKGIKEKSQTASIKIIANLPDLSSVVEHRVKLGPTFGSMAQLEETVSSTNENGETDLYFVGSYRSEATLSIAGSGKRRRNRNLKSHEYDSFRSILSQIRDAEQYPEITGLASLYSTIRIYSEWEFGRNSSLRESTSASRSDTTLSESMNDLPLILNGIANTSAHEKIRELLKNLKETYLDFVTRILFGRVGLELYEVPFEFPIPAERLSDGTLRFLALAAILLQPTPPPFICLEEPELGMHPDMIRMVAKMIVEASAKTQIIVTTHSEHLLSALQDDFDALFAFDSGLSGSVVRRFSKEQYESWQEDNNLGDLWTSGELGGNRW